MRLGLDAGMVGCELIIDELQWGRGLNLGWDYNHKPFVGFYTTLQWSRGLRLGWDLALRQEGLLVGLASMGQGLNIECKLTLAERWQRCNCSGRRRGKDVETASAKPSPSKS